MKQLKVCLSLSILALSGCQSISIPNTTVCTAAGSLQGGAVCATTLSNQTSQLSLDQYIDFLEAQPERPDPDHPGQTLPARAGALCQSSFDWNLQKTALEQACRELGDKCSDDVKRALRHYQKAKDLVAP